jgi:hypothetical protein
MPDYQGPWQNDTWFNEKVKSHLLPSREKTHGDVHIARVEQSDWLSHRSDIAGKMASEFTMPGKGAGLGQTFYDTKDNLSHDAMTCWRVEHGRTLNCQDYMSDKKKIKPDTRAERKAEGMDASARPSIYLCQFCPVHAHVLQKKKSEVFGYNYNP